MTQVETQARAAAAALESARAQALEEELRELTLSRCDAFRAAVHDDILPLAQVRSLRPSVTLIFAPSPPSPSPRQRALYTPTRHLKGTQHAKRACLPRVRTRISQHL